MANLCLVFILWRSSNRVQLSFAIILLKKKELVALPNYVLALMCIVSVLCLFLMVQWVGLWCVIVAFPGHTHLVFINSQNKTVNYYYLT